MAETLPSTYKACVYSNPGTNEISIRDDMPMPKPGPGEVLVKITHTGVCHSDMAVMMNSWAALPHPTQKGQVGGHEGVGSVVELGLGSDRHRKIGDRVGIKWIAAACGTCKSCLEGSDGACGNGRKISGYYTPGTFQQYVLAPAHYVTPIPDGLDSAVAAPILCAGTTVFSALRKSGLRAGQSIVVLGAGGGLGHFAVQIASRGMGAQVIGIDHSSKEELVRKSGATGFVSYDRIRDVVEEVKSLTGGGANVAFVVAGNNHAYAQGLATLGHGGKLLCVGVPEGEPQVIAGAFPAALIFKEISIVGSAVGNRLDAIEILDMAARGLVEAPLRLEKMERLAEVFDEMAKGTLQGRVVLEISS